MLFLRYLWDETLLRLFIPVILGAPFLLWWIMSWGMPLPWLLNTIVWLIGLGVLSLIVFLIAACGIALHEHIWEKGYLKWKEDQNLPSSDAQQEREKIVQVVERYKIEQKIRNDNPTADKIYEEYQIILALTDGVEVFEEIEFVHKWDGELYENCLKSKDQLR